MTQFKMQKKVTKINLRIISKLHTHLQTMTKAPVKFQKDRQKSVGEVAYTGYLLLEGVQNHGKPNTMSPRFSSKRRGTTNQLCYDRDPDIRQTSCPKATGTKLPAGSTRRAEGEFSTL